MVLVRNFVDVYTEAAIKHGEATKDGNSTVANNCYDELIRARDKLLDFGLDGERTLLSLLTHTNESVRLWAATHCLNLDEEKSLKVLSELSASNSIFGFNASMVIEERVKGNI